MKEFTFIWRVENYSCCWHKKGEYLRSPTFIADPIQGTAWNIQLYPRNNEYIQLYLHRSGECCGPEMFHVKYELSFLAQDGSSLTSRSTDLYYSFWKGCENGFCNFTLREKVLIEERNEYLSQDTLTVRCRMWIGTGDIIESAQCFGSTRILVEKISAVHVVERYSSMESYQKKSLKINCHSNPNSYIIVSVNSPEEDSCEEKIMFEIATEYPQQITVFTSKIYILNSKGESVQCGQADMCYDLRENDGKLLRVPLCFTKQELLSEKSKYLPKDMLTLRCDCSFVTKLTFEQIEEIDYRLDLVPVLRPIIRNAPLEQHSILDDLRYLYENQTLTDMSLKTETGTFPAHKTILCARSSVFKAMLTSDMKERTSNCIEVEDLDNDIMHQLLLFIYTDALNDLQWNTAIKLYYAADKYEIKLLKTECSDFLMKYISVINACDILVLADMHQDSKLKTFVEDFVVVHDEEIFCSAEWESFMTSHPQLAMQTMHMKYKKKMFKRG